MVDGPHPKSFSEQLRQGALEGAEVPCPPHLHIVPLRGAGDGSSCLMESCGVHYITTNMYVITVVKQNKVHSCFPILKTPFIFLHNRNMLIKSQNVSYTTNKRLEIFQGWIAHALVIIINCFGGVKKGS